MTLRPITIEDQEQMAPLICATFEKYGAPLTDTVYDDPRTSHLCEEMPNTTTTHMQLYLQK